MREEGITIGEEALLAIGGVEGGLRDAESALDQSVTFQGKEIAEEDVLSVFGLLSREGLGDERAILASDVPGLF